MNEPPFINIIVPAYNEEKRIGESVRTLVAYLRESAFPYPYVVTIVDNGSTDGTTTRAEKLVRHYPGTVELIVLKEKGKGRAVRRGWQGRGDVLVFMDADLSSDLSYVRALIDAIVVRGFDLATGNRLGEHSLIVNRHIVRGTVSRIYNATIRLVFGSRLADHQCGFKAIRKDVFERIDPLLRDTGWFFDSELLIVAQRLGYRIASIDIRWKDERQSKVSLLRTSYDMAKAILGFSRRLPRIVPGAGGNIPLVAEVTRFLTSGGVAAAVNLGLFWFLYEIVRVHYLTAVVETSVVVFLVSFTLQKTWTFQDPRMRTVPVQFPLYALSAVCTVMANAALLFLLVEFLGLWPVAAQTVSLGLIATANFFVYKFLVFRRRA